MPLFHVGGSSYVLFGIHDGVPSVMTRDPDGASLAGAILAGANRTFLVPAVLAQVLQSGPDAVELFGLLKTYTYGASPMPLPLLRAAMRGLAGHRLHPGLRAHRGGRRGHPPDARRTTATRPTPSGWSPPARRSPGARCGSSTRPRWRTWPSASTARSGSAPPQLMKGYLDKPEETAEVITEDGWFRTGDIGRVDDDGFVFVEDRLKDMIISGGENIYSPGDRAGAGRAPRGDRGRDHRRPRRALGRDRQGRGLAEAGRRAPRRRS